MHACTHLSMEHNADRHDSGNPPSIRRTASPPHGATLLVVDLDELAEAAGVVVVGCLCVSKSLQGDS
jgi:hypothetical protein